MDKAKAMVKGRMLLRIEDTRSVAGWVGAQQLLNNEVKTIDEIIDIVDNLSVADLQRVATDVIKPGILNLAVVGPFRSQARFARHLRG